MFKKLLYLLTIISLPSLFAMESEFKKLKLEEQFEHWSELPPELQQAILKHLFVLDSKIENIITRTLDSYKQYLKLPKLIDKQYQAELAEAYKSFLLNNLTDEDFKELNQYILRAIKFSPKTSELSLNLTLMIKLLTMLGKLDTSTTDQFGLTMLLAAYGLKDIVQLLIEAGTDVNEQDVHNKQTTLIKASATNKKDVVELLIAEGANLNIKDKNGRTALVWALESNNLDIAKLLIRAGADVNIAYENGAYGEGFTPLMLASGRGYQDIVRLLIDAGANVNAVNEMGITALGIHMEKDQEIADMLIEAGATYV